MEVFLQLLLLAAGLILLVKGADWFVDGASGLATRFGIPQLVIGLTIVAMGTSAPEAAVSITSALKGNADITIGNIVGSNILNILIILGLSAVITPLAVARSTVRVEIPFMIAITLILLWMGWDQTVGLLDGILLLLLFLLYLGYLFRMAQASYVIKAEKSLRKEENTLNLDKVSHAQENPEKEEIPEKPNIETPNIETKTASQKKGWFLALLTFGGLFLVILGSNLTVDAASAIARVVGLSERFIGLTIVALGTSLPELFTSVSAARKGNADIAIGNIVGSNVFNILFVIGLSALIIPVSFASAFRLDTLVAIAAAVFLWLCCFRNQKLQRAAGAGMLLGYLVYFIWICR